MNTPQANPAAAGRPDPDRVPPPLPPSGPTPGWAPPPPNPGWPAPTVPQGQWQPPHGAPGGPQPGQWQPPGGPGGPQFAAPPQGRPPRRPIIILGLVVGVVVLLAVGGWVAWSVLRDDGPSYPDVWDPRVAELADYVADHGGEPFDTPVHVDFLSDEEFRAEVTSEEADLTDEDREMIAQAEAQMRALGLVEGDFDLFEAQNQLDGESTAAFYNPETKRVTVRGTEMTLDVEVTVVHELVHAWQDQQVDLMEVEDGLDGDGAYLRYRAVVEGHAVNVMNDYVADELTQEQAEEYYGTREEQGEAVGEVASDVLSAFTYAPYVLGPYFVAVIEELEGADAVIEMLREPPASVEQLLDPRLYLDGVEPVTVEVMDLPDGGDELDQGAFDVLDVFLLLASRMEASEALDVADGWAGGSYLAYEDSEDTVCLAVRIQADSAEARDALVGGFETWAGFLPSATVTSSEAPLEVELTSCDPGDQRSSEPINAVDDAMAAPAVRLILMAEMLVGGVDGAESAWCVADGVVDELSLEQLQGEPDLEVQRLVRNVMSECSVIP